MDKPVGGRGHIAPYKTVVVRIPRPLEPVVTAMVARFRSEGYRGVFSPILLYTAVVLARKVLSRKKSVRVSVNKLLGVLYPGSEVEL